VSANFLAYPLNFGVRIDREVRGGRDVKPGQTAHEGTHLVATIRPFIKGQRLTEPRDGRVSGIGSCVLRRQSSQCRRRICPFEKTSEQSREAHNRVCSLLGREP
jgi:hypothetical protein